MLLGTQALMKQGLSGKIQTQFIVKIITTYLRSTTTGHQLRLKPALMCAVQRECLILLGANSISLQGVPPPQKRAQ